jgi:hypothetical protein
MKMKSPRFKPRQIYVSMTFQPKIFRLKTMKIHSSLKSADGRNRRRIIYPPFFGHFWLSQEMSILPFARGSFETRNAKPRKNRVRP